VDEQTKIFLKHFGDKLRKCRNAQQISQEQLAFESQLTREYINRVENGKINVSLKNIIAISRVLGIHPKEMLDIDIN
jgi:transcriptional regulator with XRE-family HTH domain